MIDSNLHVLPPWGCNICYEESRDPVCTTCGHLFCWPCLYAWIQDNIRDKPCPVCRNLLTSDANIIPVYGATTTRGDREPPQPPGGGAAVPVIPPRPHPPRRRPQTKITWDEVGARYENMRHMRVQETMNRASLAGRPQEVTAQMQRVADADARSLARSRNFCMCREGVRNACVAVDTTRSGSRTSTRNARN